MYSHVSKFYIFILLVETENILFVGTLNTSIE